MSGSPVTLPQPTRLNGTVVLTTLKLCSQSLVPSSAFQQVTISFLATPSPVRPFAQTRPSKTAGVDLATYSWNQIRFSPSVDQLDTSPVSSETPFCDRPRQLGQSLAEAAPAIRTRQRHRMATDAAEP